MTAPPIARYDLDCGSTISPCDGLGDWVRYDDYLEAIAAAEVRGREQGLRLAALLVDATAHTNPTAAMLSAAIRALVPAPKEKPDE